MNISQEFTRIGLNPPPLEQVRLTLSENNIQFRVVKSPMEKVVASYQAHPDGHVFRIPRRSVQEVRVGTDFTSAACADFSLLIDQAPTIKWLLLDTKVTDESYPLEDYKKYLLEGLEGAMNRLGRLLKIQVLDVTFNVDEDDLLCLLPFFEPETLEVIHLKRQIRDDAENAEPLQLNLERVVMLEQWKHAKAWTLHHYAPTVTFQQWTHSAMVGSCISQTLSSQSFRSLMQELVAAGRGKWECSIKCSRGNVSQLSVSLNNYEYRRVICDGECCRIRFPNSRMYFEVHLCAEMAMTHVATLPHP